MKKNINIAVVGLGNIGIYLLNEINSKRKNIELLTGKKINISAVSAKNIKKKRKFKFNKSIFYKNPLNMNGLCVIIIFYSYQSRLDDEVSYVLNSFHQ